MLTSFQQKAKNSPIDTVTESCVMELAELSRIVNNIAHQCIQVEKLGYFECLEALDALEFHILDRIDSSPASDELAAVREQAQRLHTALTAHAQATIDHIIQDIRTQQRSPLALRQLFYQYAQSVPDKAMKDEPDYDLFDEFLSHLFQVAYEPIETRSRTEEMVYLQATPGRIILDMIHALSLTSADRFYDLGSGLGLVPILVALLTDAYAVGIEYEPSYVHYSQCAAQKLGVSRVEFRNLDAQDAALGDGTVFFMFTPFTGGILRKVLNTLHDLSKERPITLCSYGPCTPIIAQETWLYPIQYCEEQIYRLALLRSKPR